MLKQIKKKKQQHVTISASSTGKTSQGSVNALIVSAVDW